MSQYPQLKMLIAGEWLGAEGRNSEPVLNPATGQSLGTLPHASTADLDRALEAAQKALPVWANTPAYERARILRKTADAMRERADAIAEMLTLEEGKPHPEAKIEVLAAADVFEFMAEEGKRAYGRIIPARAGGTRHIVLKQPVGVTAAFAPWNFPAITPARKMAASLAAGCPCIIKPSEETPATAIEMARLITEAGAPAGVIQVVFGVPGEVSTHIMASDIIRKVSFTGSTAVGKQLMKLAAEKAQRTTMELGGHAPVLVFDDVDAEKAAVMAVAGKFRNAGQVCVSPTRFMVHEKSHAKFVETFAKAAEALKIGNGMESGIQMGPLANPRRVDAMTAFIADATSKGAKLHTGGERMGNEGFFFRPTVLSDVPMNARMMTEEPFGPVALINRFSSEEEAFSEANRLPFGLAAYAFTRDSDRAIRLQERVESGLLGINTFGISVAETPFGGVKESGHGSEGGPEGLEAYLTTKFVAHGPGL
ncbi:NAD-dependent succinate-semialdehyde dehydrogenase [Sabulicella rubraurantiaca]|uniref:NAD-dependent succinate-semialdehyde dehydrogenase n=1 Tax=Sabulicella rubraurantiaca TaxID=2811429 RepID=UPI001A96047B|nr:NAD-dependent succinate-semialdehyde dehydrogenase [Sabulicella rubraurantiaca]